MRIKWLAIATIVIFFTSCLEDDTTIDTNKTRYKDADVFEFFLLDAGITYTSTAGGGTTSLSLDFFQPSGDTETERPLIILAPGGGFTTLNKDDMVTLARKFARSGYTCAVMNYRVSNSSNPTRGELIQAVIDARSDMKSAIRFFVKEAQNGNTYGIDTNKIWVGGHSAGAITALHTGFLTNFTISNIEIDSFLMANGGLTGNSGNDGFSCPIRGVINMSGAVLDLNLISASKPRILSLHGTADDVVPFAADTVSTGDVPILMYGSDTIDNRAMNVGIIHELVNISGGSHDAPLSDTECPGCYTDMLNFLFNNL